MNPTGIDANESAIRSPSVRFRLADLRWYGLAALSVGVGLGSALLLQHFQFRDAGIPLLAFACAVSSWYGGVRPALLAVVLASMWFSYFFVEPVYSFTVRTSDLPYFTIFVSFAALISWFATIRRRVEEDLRQSRDRLEIEVAERTQLNLTLNLTHDAILVRDLNDSITYWNQGAEELYGWTRQQAVGKRSHSLFQTVFPAAIADIDAELLRTGRWEGELNHTKPDGSRVVVLSRWSLRHDEEGRPKAILETNNDITERKRREKEIERLNQELAERSIALETSNRELEAFAYSISHDLRAPLRHMAGFAELLRKNAAAALNEKDAQYVTMILEAANRMGSLIDDLLAFSRIGGAEADDSLLSLEELVQEAVAEVRQDANERKILWKIHALPAWYGDRSMLRMALVNLISNAVKFTRTRPQAEIEIGCMEHNEEHVVLFVRDNGVGFNMKYSNKLFGVFQRLHAQDAFEGSGIGLATVQRIAHRHGGRAWAEGVVDGGATFYFSLSKIKGASTIPAMGTTATLIDLSQRPPPDQA